MEGANKFDPNEIPNMVATLVGLYQDRRQPTAAENQAINEFYMRYMSKAMEECQEMFDLVISALVRSIQAIEEEDPKLAQEVVDLEDRIDYMEKTLRAQHIARLNAGGCTPGGGVVFIDILSNLERVGDHAHNLAMVVFDIERMHKRSLSTKH
mgnify:CR=1 FL=1